jgi:hypothetical protein
MCLARVRDDFACEQSLTKTEVMNSMFGTTTKTERAMKKMRATGTDVVDGIRHGGQQIGRYAVEHKALSIAGAIALGALGYGIVALLRRNRVS